MGRAIYYFLFLPTFQDPLATDNEYDRAPPVPAGRCSKILFFEANKVSMRTSLDIVLRPASLARRRSTMRACRGKFHSIGVLSTGHGADAAESATPVSGITGTVEVRNTDKGPGMPSWSGAAGGAADTQAGVVAESAELRNMEI
jgi:hypothetical protein